MNDKIAAAKLFVAKNKMKIVTTVAVAATAVAVVEQIAIRQHNEFLKEKNLFDEYYTEED